ncbi:hypothetical protein trd_A0206 (plasmid) [Thermomicrobium roseum DSM 5159]|uniref:Uncharacterized protein n=1 Tax=Thermomicrobium roseum (strain ATCC 27502 / DSM 5159 / P-2) TaxID=309801 RepID=B9L342_THERP|nr:hypothetical protein trd_A0206 [Thermomicrobium roseum DSM 5159]
MSGPHGAASTGEAPHALPLIPATLRRRRPRGIVVVGGGSDREPAGHDPPITPDWAGEESPSARL